MDSLLLACAVDYLVLWQVVVLVSLETLVYDPWDIVHHKLLCFLQERQKGKVTLPFRMQKTMEVMISVDLKIRINCLWVCSLCSFFRRHLPCSKFVCVFLSWTRPTQDPCLCYEVCVLTKENVAYTCSYHICCLSLFIYTSKSGLIVALIVSQHSYPCK